MSGAWLSFPDWMRARGRSLGPSDLGEPVPVAVNSAPWRVEGAAPATSGQIALYRRSGKIPLAQLATHVFQVIPPGYYDTAIVTARTGSAAGASALLLRGQLANLLGYEGVDAYTFPTDLYDDFADEESSGGGTPTHVVTRALELPLSNLPIAVYCNGSFGTSGSVYLTVTVMTTRR